MQRSHETMEETTGFCVHWIPGQSRDSIEIWVKPACCSWRMTVCHCRGMTLEAKISGIIISVNSPGADHFGKIWPTHQGWESPRQNNKTGGNTVPPISKQAPWRPLRHTATPNHIQGQRPTHQRDKNQLHRPVGRYQSLPSGNRASLHAKFSHKGVRHQKPERLQLYCLQKGDHTKNLYTMKWSHNPVIMTQIMGQGKTKKQQQQKKPRKTSKWSGDYQTPWKRPKDFRLMIV